MLLLLLVLLLLVLLIVALTRGKQKSFEKKADNITAVNAQKQAKHTNTKKFNYKELIEEIILLAARLLLQSTTSYY